MTNTNRAAIKFFASHAGGIVGEAMLTGLHLARAEMRAESLGWVVRWEGDEFADAAESSEWCPTCARISKRDRSLPGHIRTSHTHETLCAVLVDASGDVLGSLGGIIDPDRAYMRVVAAELAIEVLGEIDDRAAADKRAGEYMAL